MKIREMRIIEIHIEKHCIVDTYMMHPTLRN